MLKFNCESNMCDAVIKTFVSGFVSIMKSTELTTLACNHYDKELENEVCGLIEKMDNGFVFDKDDQIGSEPYGYVSDFFECFIGLIGEIKEQFSSIGIDGYVFVNDFGPYECTMRQRVYATPDTNNVQFFDQLQCIKCGKWVDVDKAYKQLEEDDFGDWPMINEEPLLPNSYSTSGTEAVFCICSTECNKKED